MFGLFTKSCKDCGKKVSRAELDQESGHCKVCAYFDRTRHAALFYSSEKLNLFATALAENPTIGSTRICKELQKDWPGGVSRERINYRRILLAALEKIGDIQTAAVVADLAKHDETILSEAGAVLQAIKLRHPSASLPTTIEPSIWQPKSVAPTGSLFVDSCFPRDLREVQDPRRWDDDEDLRMIPRLIQDGRTDEARDILRLSSGRMTDCHFIFSWRATIEQKAGDISSARRVLIEGIAKSRRKYPLLQGLGDLEFAAGNMHEAFRWWMQSVAVQLSISELQSWPAFVNLGFVARELGESETANRLISIGDKIYGGGVGLSPEMHKRLGELLQSIDKGDLVRALRLLNEQYLVP